MATFLQALDVTPYADGRTWWLRRNFVYTSSLYEVPIVVPRTFTTDFASVPRLMWVVFPPWGLYGNAAVVHDYLYATQFVPRPTADAVFMEAMAVSAVPTWQKWPLFLAVRLFGFWAWRQNRSKRVRGLRKMAAEPLLATSKPHHWK